MKGGRRAVVGTPGPRAWWTRADGPWRAMGSPRAAASSRRARDRSRRARSSSSWAWSRSRVTRATSSCRDTTIAAAVRVSPSSKSSRIRAARASCRRDQRRCPPEERSGRRMRPASRLRRNAGRTPRNSAARPVVSAGVSSSSRLSAPTASVRVLAFVLCSYSALSRTLRCRPDPAREQGERPEVLLATAISVNAADAPAASVRRTSPGRGAERATGGRTGAHDHPNSWTRYVVVARSGYRE